MKLRFSRKTLCIPYAVFLLFFVIAPMLVIVFYAFTDKNNHVSFPASASSNTAVLITSVQE